MGMGVLGQHAAFALARLGFDVAGWSAAPKPHLEIKTFSGPDTLDDFCRRTDILICLLPLTQETRGILNADLFARLATDGPFGPVVINVGRGGLQKEEDLVTCLDDGTLKGATLDVFQTEPLPEASPLWRHPLVRISPHNATEPDPDGIAEQIAAQIRAFEAGEPLPNVVDRRRGY